MIEIGPTTNEWTEVHRTFSVSGAEPLKPGYSGTGLFDPDQVVAKYIKSVRNGEDHSSVTAEVRGYRQKSNGTPSLKRSGTTYWAFENMPEWLATAIKDLAPW